MKLRCAVAFVCGLLFLAYIAPATAAPPRELGWDELIPERKAFDDPFTALTGDQFYLLATVARYCDRRVAGVKASDEAIRAENDALALDRSGGAAE